MSDLELPIEASPDADQSAAGNENPSQHPALVTESEPPVLATERPQPVLITEGQVLFATAAALRPRSTPITRRVIDTFRVVVGAFRLPPPRPHYPRGGGYIERASMAREMDRL